MLIFSTESIFDVPAEALVNPVNCVGVSGKGLALSFRKRFPDNYQHYRETCLQNQLKLGEVLVFERTAPPRFIINFPTKYHWRNPSHLSAIEQGLGNLKCAVRQYAIQSIAIPALGCGLGGLEWKNVRPLLEAFAESLPDVEVYLFPPKEGKHE